MRLFRRYRDVDFWPPRRVPEYPVEVDFSHPLGTGMVACYVPGSVFGLADLTGVGPELAAGINGMIVPSPEGIGYSCNSINGPAYAMSCPSEWQITTSGTMFWRGGSYGPSQPGIASCVWGMVQNGNFQSGGSSNVTSPFCYGLSFDTSQSVVFSYAVGTTATLLFGLINCDTQMQGIPTSMAVSFTVGGTITLYIWYVDASGAGAPKNPHTVVTGTWSGSAPDYTQAPQLSIGCDSPTQDHNSSHTVTTSAYLYNRVLSAAQITMLNADPFAMLRPRLRNSRAPLATAGTPYRRWNRTYLIR